MNCSMSVPRARSLRMYFATLLVAGCHVGQADEGEQRSSFTSEQRQRIDDNSLWGPREKQNIAQVEAYGSALQWLVARTPLPVAEEIERAAKKHDEVLAKFKTFDTPASATEVLSKLVKTLPAPLRPKEYEYALTVVDQDDASAFTVGAGHIYLSRQFLNAISSDDRPARTDRIAFVLAHEIGHLSLGHVRRLYQRQWLHEQLANEVDAAPEERAKSNRFLDDFRGVGVVLEHAYSRQDDFYADLFAVHLCRNAGFNVENGLDVLRRTAVDKDAALLNVPPPREGDPPVEPEVQKAVTGEEFTLAEPPSPMHRLRRLRLELDGLIYGDDYGMFELDRKTNALKSAGDKSIAEGERVVVFVHGMESSLEVYIPLVKRLAEVDAEQKVRILGFQYPSDESLARSAKYLLREMRRVGAHTTHVDFVCHSAGGLVLRHYVEIDRGNFRRVYFQGTPQHGSDLAALRSLLEASQFLGDLDLGYDAALAKAIRDGSGQISHDLLPDSLFLEYLNAPREKLSRDRYVIYRGQALSRTRVFFLNAAVVAATTSLARTLGDEADDNPVTAFARSALDSLVIPKEITDGDLCVTRDSALLDGVEQVHDRALSHTALPRDPQTIEELAQQLVGEN